MDRIKSQTFKIGLYQISGGSLGVIFLIYALLKSNSFSGLIILVYLLMLLFFSYSIFCGTICVTNKSTALRHSLINQFLQLISFAVLGFAFNYVAGLYLTVGLDLSKSIEMQFGLGLSKFDFNINNEHDRIEVGLNLISVGLIYWIDKLNKQIRQDKKD